ncbi:hypothetical protein GGI42DRAFT_198696 [Trichoderma sp. SZMC 28013]
MLLWLYHRYDYDFVSFSVAQGFGFWSVRATGNNVARSFYHFFFCFGFVASLIANLIIYLFFIALCYFWINWWLPLVRRVAIYLCCYVFFEPGYIDILASMMLCFYNWTLSLSLSFYSSLSFLSCSYLWIQAVPRIYITQ